MQPLQDRGVPISERDGGPGSTPDWEAVHIFLEVARQGSFRSAADHLGLSINALRRRISELEHQLGVQLFTRHVDGVRITSEGEEILAAARKMELASFGLIRARDRSAPAVAGEVRLAVTEGLGTFWLAPRLVEFQRAYPKLIVDLSCAMRSADVLRLEADASVQLTKPTNPDLKIVKLGRLHSMPFAGKSYIDTYGIPKDVQDGLKHRLVLQVAEQTATQELFERIYPGVTHEGFVALRTNVSSAHYWSIAKGAGIGFLPTYAQAIGARVVPVDVGLHFHFDIWLTYHADGGRIPRVRKMIDWLIEAFDPKRYPWFRDDFLHPKDLPKEYRGAPISSLFEGFFGTSSESAAPPARSTELR
ncbi:MAG: LysR family transcriptional regulator [Xanthobacteraceae bacterium]|nr:LysR family transcriptional regulator [Xanthobacteraceae bacterium]